MAKPASFLRRVLAGAIASLALGGVLASTLAVPAVAAETHSLTVTVSSVTGTPLTGMTISAIPVENGREIVGDQKPDGSYQKAAAVSGKPGVYTFASLGDFDHTLYFGTATKTTFAQLLGGASDLARAEVVPAGQATLSVSLATNAVIKGVVKSSSGSVIPKALVTAYWFDGSEWVEYSSARADSKGTYTLIDLDPGSYRLRFAGATATRSPMFSGGVATFESATAYPVGVGTTTTVNATFPKGVGAITGKAQFDYEGDAGYGLFWMAKAVAVAIPVTTTGTYPYRVLDLDRAVSSAPTSSSGSWAIKNLAPGAYVVKLYPYYYNQAAVYVGGQHLSSAKVINVSAGKTSSGHWAYSYATDEGGYFSVTVKRAGALTPIANADVLLQNDVDPDYYFQGTTDASGVVTLGKSGSRNILQPGTFTLTVTTQGAFQPQVQSYYLEYGSNAATLYLNAPAGAPGFASAPSIAETSLAVGTRYEVAAQANRGTSTLNYQWFRDGRPIWGADAAAYTSTAGDIGAQLTVRVESREFGFPVDEAEAAVAGLVVSSEAPPTNIVSPKITPSAEPHVGTTLRIHPGTWSVPGLSFSFEWFRDGVPFENTGDSYVVTLGDLDSEITATVTARKAGLPDAEATTPVGVTPVFADAAELRSALAIKKSTSGLSTGSTKYTVSPGTWTALTPTFSYEWLRGGVVIGTGATLVEKPTTAQKGQTLEVRVTATAPGFGPGQATIVARKASLALQLAATPVVTLPGDATPLASASAVAYGTTATVTSGTWAHGADELGSLSYDYQWLRKVGTNSPAKISGATDATYSPKTSDVGAKLTVKVTAHSSRWGDASVTVAAGTVVGADALVTAGEGLDLVYEYDAEQYVVDDIIKAPISGGWLTAGAKVSYQWYGCAPATCTATTPPAKFTKISGATGFEWKVTKAYAGGRVFVVLTASKAGFRTARVETSPVAIGVLKKLFVKQRPSVGGSTVAALGTTIYGSWGLYSRVPLGVNPVRTPSWQLCTADCDSPTATWTAVGSAQYSLVVQRTMWGDGNSRVRLAVTVTADGYESATGYSDSVSVGKAPLSGFEVPTVSTVATRSWKLSTGSVPAHMTYSVEWYVDDEVRSTTKTFAALESDIGKKIYVVQRFTAPGYYDYESVKVVQSGTSTTVPTRDVAIIGNSFGETLTLSDAVPWELPELPHANWVISYDWTIGSTAYQNSGPSYTPTTYNVGSSVSVLIRATSPLYTSLIKQVNLTGPILPGTALDLAEPIEFAWQGDLVPGVTIAASAPSYAVPGVATAYQWQSSADGSEWQNVAGATSSGYTVALIDSLRQLRLKTTASKTGHTTVTHYTDAVQVLEGDVIRLLATPTLTGDARVGAKLTASAGAWSDGVTIGYQWRLNGRAIPGATSTTYIPLATNAGDELSVIVTARQAGKLDVSAETAALTIQKGLAPVATKAPVISGTTTLTATPGVWNVSGLTFSFEWKRGDEVISTTPTLVVESGFTKADYVLTVKATRYGYEDGVKTVP